MIERNHSDLSIGQQCVLLSISRSSFYYEAKGETAVNLSLMLQIDKQFLETPLYGARVSDLLCMNDLAHASKLKEHDDNDDF